jgi:hypothetical protein
MFSRHTSSVHRYGQQECSVNVIEVTMPIDFPKRCSKVPSATAEDGSDVELQVEADEYKVQGKYTYSSDDSRDEEDL